MHKVLPCCKRRPNLSADLDLASIARMWRGGCIIRSIFLNDIAAAFEAQQKPKHLLLAPYFREEI